MVPEECPVERLERPLLIAEDAPELDPLRRTQFRPSAGDLQLLGFSQAVACGEPLQCSRVGRRSFDLGAKCLEVERSKPAVERVFANAGELLGGWPAAP